MILGPQSDTNEGKSPTREREDILEISANEMKEVISDIVKEILRKGQEQIYFPNDVSTSRNVKMTAVHNLHSSPEENLNTKEKLKAFPGEELSAIENTTCRSVHAKVMTSEFKTSSPCTRAPEASTPASISEMGVASLSEKELNAMSEQNITALPQEELSRIEKTTCSSVHAKVVTSELQTSSCTLAPEVYAPTSVSKLEVASFPERKLNAMSEQNIPAVPQEELSRIEKTMYSSAHVNIVRSKLELSSSCTLAPEVYAPTSVSELEVVSLPETFLKTMSEEKITALCREELSGIEKTTHSSVHAKVVTSELKALSTCSHVPEVYAPTSVSELEVASLPEKKLNAMSEQNIRVIPQEKSSRIEKTTCSSVHVNMVRSRLELSSSRTLAPEVYTPTSVSKLEVVSLTEPFLKTMSKEKITTFSQKELSGIEKTTYSSVHAKVVRSESKCSSSCTLGPKVFTPTSVSELQVVPLPGKDFNSTSEQNINDFRQEALSPIKQMTYGSVHAKVVRSRLEISSSSTETQKVYTPMSVSELELHEHYPCVETVGGINNSKGDCSVTVVTEDGVMVVDESITPMDDEDLYLDMYVKTFTTEPVYLSRKYLIASVPVTMAEMYSAVMVDEISVDISEHRIEAELSAIEKTTYGSVCAKVVTSELKISSSCTPAPEVYAPISISELEIMSLPETFLKTRSEQKIEAFPQGLSAIEKTTYNSVYGKVVRSILKLSPTCTLASKVYTPTSVTELEVVSMANNYEVRSEETISISVPNEVIFKTLISLQQHHSCMETVNGMNDCEITVITNDGVVDVDENIVPIDNEDLYLGMYIRTFIADPKYLSGKRFKTNGPVTMMEMYSADQITGNRSNTSVSELEAVSMEDNYEAKIETLPISIQNEMKSKVMVSLHQQYPCVETVSGINDCNIAVMTNDGVVTVDKNIKLSEDELLYQRIKPKYLPVKHFKINQPIVMTEMYSAVMADQIPVERATVMNSQDVNILPSMSKLSFTEMPLSDAILECNCVSQEILTDSLNVKEDELNETELYPLLDETVSCECQTECDIQGSQPEDLSLDHDSNPLLIGKARTFVNQILTNVQSTLAHSDSNETLRKVNRVESMLQGIIDSFDDMKSDLRAVKEEVRNVSTMVRTLVVNSSMLKESSAATHPVKSSSTQKQDEDSRKLSDHEISGPIPEHADEKCTLLNVVSQELLYRGIDVNQPLHLNNTSEKDVDDEALFVLAAIAAVTLALIIDTNASRSENMQSLSLTHLPQDYQSISLDSVCLHSSSSSSIYRVSSNDLEPIIYETLLKAVSSIEDARKRESAAEIVTETENLLQTYSRKSSSQETTSNTEENASRSESTDLESETKMKDVQNEKISETQDASPKLKHDRAENKQHELIVTKSSIDLNDVESVEKRSETLDASPKLEQEIPDENRKQFSITESNADLNDRESITETAETKDTSSETKDSSPELQQEMPKENEQHESGIIDKNEVELVTKLTEIPATSVKLETEILENIQCESSLDLPDAKSMEKGTEMQYSSPKLEQEMPEDKEQEISFTETNTDINDVGSVIKMTETLDKHQKSSITVSNKDLTKVEPMAKRRETLDTLLKSEQEIPEGNKEQEFSITESNP